MSKPNIDLLAAEHARVEEIYAMGQRYNAPASLVEATVMHGFTATDLRNVCEDRRLKASDGWSKAMKRTGAHV